MNEARINKIFRIFQEHTPSPKTELNSINQYTLLVAVILSAQATDLSVNKATADLFKKVSTPEDMIILGETKLKSHIRNIGLFNSKAKNILLMSEILIKRYNSQIPQDLENLTSLPGVGIKTAKVVLNAAFNKPLIAVDTHVFRTSQRLGLSKEQNIKKLGEDIERKVPNRWKRNAHHWLVLHGRYTCKARKPLCADCILKKECEYFKNQDQAL